MHPNTRVALPVIRVNTSDGPHTRNCNDPIDVQHCEIFRAAIILVRALTGAKRWTFHRCAGAFSAYGIERLCICHQRWQLPVLPVRGYPRAFVEERPTRGQL